MRGLGNVFGMSTEGDTGIIDNTLVYRAGDHGSKATGLTARNGVIEGLENIACITAVQHAGLGRGVQGHWQHAAFAGLRAAWFEPGIKRPQAEWQCQLSRTGLQQVRVAQGHQLDVVCLLCQLHTQVRADTGRFSGCEGNAWTRLRQGTFSGPVRYPRCGTRCRPRHAGVATTGIAPRRTCESGSDCVPCCVQIVPCCHGRGVRSLESGASQTLS